MQQTEASSDPYHLYPLQTSFGAPVFATNEDGSYSDQLALGGDAGHAYADYLAALGEKGVLSPAVTADVAKAAFLAGQSPYIVTGPWNTGEFVDAGLPDQRAPGAAGRTAALAAVRGGAGRLRQQREPARRRTPPTSSRGS